MVKYAPYDGDVKPSAEIMILPAPTLPSGNYFGLSHSIKQTIGMHTRTHRSKN
jgi:hypothetical protein